MTIKAYSIEEEINFHRKLNKRPISIEEAAKLRQITDSVKAQTEANKFPHSSAIWSDQHREQLSRGSF